MNPYPADAHDPREECGGDWGAVDEGGALEPRVQPHGVVQAIGCSATLLFILASFSALNSSIFEALPPSYWRGCSESNERRTS